MFIHQNATKNTYIFFRAWILGIWLFLIVCSPVSSLSELSLIGEYSPGFLVRCFPEGFISWLFQPGSLVALKGILILGLFCMLFRFCSKSAGIILCFLLTVYLGMLSGIGEPTHTELCLLYGIYFLVLFEWADGVYKPRDKDLQVSSYGLPLAAICTTLCFTYAYIGLHRVANGGLGLFLDDSIYYWIIENSHKPKVFLFGPLDTLLYEHNWLRFLIKAGFPVFTVLEILAPLALFHRSFRAVFVIGMVFFHAFNWLFMGIVYWENILMLALFIEPAKRSS